MHARRLLTAALALFALNIVAGCGDSNTAEPVTVSVQLPADETATTPQARAAPEAESQDLAFTDAPDEIGVAVPEGYHPVVWVRTGQRVAMRTEPGGGKLVEAVGRRTQFGS